MIEDQNNLSIEFLYSPNLNSQKPLLLHASPQYFKQLVQTVKLNNFNSQHFTIK